MTKKHRCFLFFMVLLTLTGCSWPKNEPKGKLLVTDLVDEVSEMYIMDLETREVNWLVTASGGRFSPSGDMVSYFDFPYPQIYIVNIDGSNWRQLTFDEDGALEHDWSPDGEWIAYENKGWAQAIYVIRTDGTERTKVYEYEFSAGWMSWAPDGKHFVFSLAERFEPSNLFIFNLENGTMKQITDSRADDRYPEWSPDGKMIVYESEIRSSEHKARAYLYEVETGESRPLIINEQISSGTDEWGPVWSPNGEWIALMIDWRICIVDMKGNLFDCYTDEFDYFLMDWGP